MILNLYQGSNKNTRFNNAFKKAFLATDIEFTNNAEYGGTDGFKYQYTVDLNPKKVFNSTNCDDIALLYKAGYKLSDPYLHIEDNDDGPDEFGWEDDDDNFLYESDDFDVYPTAQSFCNSKTIQNNTWEAIEESHGVLDWISKHFDAIVILERGFVNYIVYNESCIKDIKRIQ